jgi:hypothetical protein
VFCKGEIKIFSFRLAYKEKKIIFGFKGLKNRSPGVSISGFTIYGIYIIYIRNKPTHNFNKKQQQQRNAIDHLE